MNLIPTPPLQEPILYPDSDGLPMSDNTRQGYWIILIDDNLTGLFREQFNVFIAQNLLWYAVEGHPEIRAAPDVLIAFGRPKGYRGSYKTWEEGGVPLTVVFEILSPGNTTAEMAAKFEFYEEHGVEEYYVYDPDANTLQVYLRRGSVLRRQHPSDGFVSPRLRISFDLSSGPEMVIRHPNGEPFLPWEDVAALRRQEAQRADDNAKRADAAHRQTLRLAELSRKARRGQASTEELAELERLEEQSLSPPPE